MGTLSTSKRILVTGASRGIGRAAALALGKQGHTVGVLAARDEHALRSLAREIAGAGGRAEVVPMDVTDDGSVERGIARLRGGAVRRRDRQPRLLRPDGFHGADMSTRRAEMDLNYWGAVRVTRALLPAMLARRSGVIVNVSSLLGIVASPTAANYSATKAALGAWSHALRGEVGRFGIKVVVFVAPTTPTRRAAVAPASTAW